MNVTVHPTFGATLLVVLLLVPNALYAYGGPGSVVSGIGALLAVLAALIAALFGFLWFPVKRFVKWFRGGDRGGDGAAEPREEFASE